MCERYRCLYLQLRHRGACSPTGRTSPCCVACCVASRTWPLPRRVRCSRSSPSLVPSRRGPASRVGRARAPARLPGVDEVVAHRRSAAGANTSHAGAPARVQLVQTFPDVCRRQERVVSRPLPHRLLELIDDPFQARGYLQGVDPEAPGEAPHQFAEGAPAPSGCPRRPAGPR